jgi:hypothetical protein
MHALAGAERVDVEATSRRGAEANDELDLWTGNDDAGPSRSRSFVNRADTAAAVDAPGPMRSRRTALACTRRV